MVFTSPSSSPPSSPPFSFDHTYSKNYLPREMFEDSRDEAVADLSRPNHHPSGPKEIGIANKSGDVYCDDGNGDSDMLCDLDLDDLDLSLSDFTMDTESSVSSFQDFVDTALSLSSSPSSHAAKLGHQDTVVLSSHFTSDRVTASNFTSKSTESTLLGKSLVHEQSTPSSQSFRYNSIPTKSSSCFEFTALDSAATCLYSSCHQKDQTILSTCTPVKKLKPGDYLPPLYIDTKSYGVTDFTDPLPLLEDAPLGRQEMCSQSNPMENKSQQLDNVVGTTHVSTSLAATTVCTDNSCLLTPLSLSDFSASDSQKPLYQREQGTPDCQLDDSMEDIDLESISDLEKYLIESSLDLSVPTTPSSKHSYPSICCTDSIFHGPKFNFCTHIEKDQNLRHEWTSEKDTGILSVPKLRLSILDGLSSKDELTSWLDQCEFNMAATPPISPCLSPDWRKSAGGATQVESGHVSKQDSNILDLFSDDNAHVFLNDDSAICQLRVSQFL